MERLFNFSEQALKERRNLLFSTAGIMIMALIVSALYFSAGMEADGRLFMTKMVIFMSGIYLLSIGLAGYFMLRQVKKIQLILNDQALLHTRKGKGDRISYAEIISCTAVRKPNGQLTMIKIKTAKQQLSLNGFEAMEEVLEIISTVQSVPMVEKKQRIDWNSPLVLISSAAITLVFFLMIASIDRDLVNKLYAVMIIAFGAYILCFRPMRRHSGSSFAKYDWVMGLVLIALGIFNLLI